MWLRFLVVLIGLSLWTSQVQARTYAAIVQDYRTGEVLHSRSADKLIYPASLTKMMTLYMLFDALDRGQLTMDSKLKVSKRASGMPASRLGLKRGETIRVRDAINALIVKSANDVAVVVAEALAETEIQFAVAMTERARELGMSKTTFKNASGLPNRRQRTTARDMARLSSRLLSDHADRYHYFATKTFSFRGRTYRSHNALVGSYPGADGLKTGYIRASGFNLASSAVRRGQRIVAIVIGGRKAQTRNAEMVRLLDLGFERLRARGPLVAVAPPKPRPGSMVQTLSLQAMPAAKSVDTDDVQIAASASPASSSSDAATVPDTSASLPVVHAPRRTAMIQAPDKAMRTDTPGSVVIAPGLSQGPSKAVAGGHYGVQVGAYHDPAKAREHAVSVAGKLPGILLQGDIDVSGLSRGRRTVYRSRVIGFTKDRAEHACAQLRQIGQECLVVQTDRVQLAASN